MTLAPISLRPIDRVVTWLTWGLVLLGTAAALSLNVADPDLWGHVQYGQDMLKEGLSATTTYSYTGQGYRWINHEILAELSLAVAANLGGGMGLMLLKTSIGLVIMGILLGRSLAKGHDFLSTTVPLFLVAATLGNYFCLRPQLGSYLFFTLELALLEWCLAGWGASDAPSLAESKSTDLHSPLGFMRSRLKYLWLGPVIFCLWTNTHGGFLAGLAVWIALLVFRSGEAWLRIGRASDGLILRLAIVAMACILVTVLNPYGAEFLTWLFDDLKVPRPEIVEWRPPRLDDVTNLPTAGLLLLTLACAFLFPKKDYTQLTILGLILWQAVSHDRHVPFFAIACGFWLPSWLQAAKNRFMGTQEEQPTTYLAQVGTAAGLLAAIVGLGVYLSPKLTTVRVERDVYPVQAAEFITQHYLHGRMVVAFNWAQYALAAWGRPDAEGRKIEVDIDGRCRTAYSQAMLDHHLDFLLGEVPASERYRDVASGPYLPELVLEQGSPDLVLISRGQPHACKVMRSREKEWTLLYRDSIAELWGFSSKYADPQSPHYIAESQRDLRDEPQTGTATWPAFPQGTAPLNPADAKTKPLAALKAADLQTPPEVHH